MQAASAPTPRRPDARVLAVDASGALTVATRTALPDLLRPGDLVVANDAATLPASLAGDGLEIRLAGRRSLEFDDIDFTAVAFGPGDHRTRTELRTLPPPMKPGDVLELGPLRATVRSTLGHPRLLSLHFEGPPEAMWAGIARHGKPIQYAHVPEPLHLWDVWTRIAAHPVAFEAPSASYVLDWSLLARLAARGIGFATLTHAAGLSSTGDPALDARLPLPEAYFIPETTARAITRASRVIALGTTVTRALEHSRGNAGAGLADQRIDRGASLEVVDGILSGAHEPGESHYALLGAFAPDDVLRRMSAVLEREGFRSHEFGDSILLER